MADTIGLLVILVIFAILLWFLLIHLPKLNQEDPDNFSSTDEENCKLVHEKFWDGSWCPICETSRTSKQ